MITLSHASSILDGITWYADITFVDCVWNPNKTTWLYLKAMQTLKVELDRPVTKEDAL